MFYLKAARHGDPNKGYRVLKKVCMLSVNCYTHLLRVCKCTFRGTNSCLTVSKVTQRELRRGVEQLECEEHIVHAKSHWQTPTKVQGQTRLSNKG